MRCPEVALSGHQAASVGTGFKQQVQKSGYRIFACSIMPDHVHLVVGRHRYSIEQVVRLMKQSATLRLKEDGRHPFSDHPEWSVWAQDFWKVFLFTNDDVFRCIRYVEDNPRKSGLPHQHWSFVVPFSDAS